MIPYSKIKSYGQELMQRYGRSLDMDAQTQSRLKSQILARVAITPQDSQAAIPSPSRLWNLPKLGIVMASLFLIFGGLAYASGKSLPGSVLYQVKMAKENIELKLAPTNQQRTLLQAEHAKERLNELGALHLGPPESLPVTVEETAHEQARIQVSSAIGSLNELEKDLQQHGNTVQAEKVQSSIENLRRQSKEQGVKIEKEDNKGEDRKGNENENKGNKIETPKASSTSGSLVLPKKKNDVRRSEDRQTATSTPDTEERDGSGNSTSPVPDYRKPEHQDYPKATSTTPQIDGVATTTPSISPTTTPSSSIREHDQQTSTSTSTSISGSGGSSHEETTSTTTPSSQTRRSDDNDDDKEGEKD